MPCRGICYRYKVEKFPSESSRYGNGRKRCNACSIFIKWEGRNCPCCGLPLRTKPRERNSRQKFMVTNQIKRI